MNELAQEVLQVARGMFSEAADWSTFYRDVLGVNGVARTKFSSPGAWLEFEKTDQHAEIQLMVAQLRSRFSAGEQEATRVITVRLPKSMHEALRVEAEQRNTSMNKLCISKLLQMVDGELIPTESPSKGNAAAMDEEAEAAVG